MKKFLLFALAVMPQAYSQCTEPFTIPYEMTAETANVPELPNCVYSGYTAFSSSEIFETTNTPVTGFTGNVFIYDTTVSEGITENAWVAVTLGTTEIAFEEGISYQASFKYGMEIPEVTIGMLRIMLAREGEYIYLHEGENIAAGIVSDFISAPFMVAEADSYHFIIEIQAEGGQGKLYLDDIAIQEAPTASVSVNLLADTGVYPNPVEDLLHLNNGMVLDTMTIYNMAGQVVMYTNNLLPLSTLEMGRFAEGVYVAELIAGTHKEVIKIVKK